MHVVAPPAANEPAGHAIGATVGSAHDAPTGHTVQFDEPAWSAYEPAGQASQSLGESAPYEARKVPGPHGTGAAQEPAQEWPTGHALQTSLSSQSAGCVPGAHGQTQSDPSKEPPGAVHAHVVKPSSLTLSAGHARQSALELPATALNVPSAHGTQAAPSA